MVVGGGVVGEAVGDAAEGGEAVVVGEDITTWGP